MYDKKFTTVVTDNKQVAETIGWALDAREKHDGYFYGNGYAVTWADETAIISSFSTLKTLLDKSESLVTAMFPGKKGDETFNALMTRLKVDKPTHRAWLPILTKSEIIKGVVEMETPLNENGTPVVQMVTVKAGETAADLLGLPMPKSGDYALDDDLLILFTNKTPLYNMETLCDDASDELGLSFAKTKEVAIALYAKGLISYPGFIQNTIPYDVWKLMEKNRETLTFNSKWGKTVKPHKRISGRHIFHHGESLANGFGIVTTGLHPIGLSRTEERLYNMIVKRVLDAFAPDKPKRKKVKRRFKKAHQEI